MVVMLPSRSGDVTGQSGDVTVASGDVTGQAAGDRAKVKSEAQRIDLKLFILILLVSSSYWWTVR